MATDRRAVAAALAALALLLLAAGATVNLFLDRRAERREAELLRQAGARFAVGLEGATAAEVPAIADAVKAELGLTGEQRQRLLDGARQRIESLPRAMTPARERKLEALVRDLYRDGTISADERAEIDHFVARERLLPAAAASFETELEDRLRKANLSLSRGQALIRTQRLEEARGEFLAATEIDPGHAVAWTNLGAANMLLGRTGDAVSCYDRALELDPESWLAHYNLGLLAARDDDRGQALEHFDRALASLSDPASPERQAVLRDLAQEPSLAELRQDPRFHRLLSGEAAGR